MPEKSLGELPPKERELYEKGRQAFERNNLDYAIALLEQVLKNEPGFYEGRQALRATQIRRAEGRGGFLKRVFGSASASPQLAKGQIALRTHPTEALRIAETILNHDPNHTAAHRLLGEAAMICGFPNTAVLSLEMANRKNPDDRGGVLKLADALIQAGNPRRAEQLLGDLARKNPNDPQLMQAAKDAAAKRTMSEGGYDQLEGGKGSYRDILRDRKEAISLEQENRDVKEGEAAHELMREYETRLAQDPDNPVLLRKLAELQQQLGQFDRALGSYQRLIDTASALDPALLKRVAEVRFKRLDQAMAQLEPDTPNYEDRLASLRAEKKAFALQECQDRAARFPNDLQIRYELGERLLEHGKFNEAIQQFQKAQNNAHVRLKALHGLGRCFAAKGIHDLATRTLETAIRETAVFDEQKKALIYELGTVLLQMDKEAEAIQQFKLIYGEDFGYRDVAQKVDAYYARMK